MRRAAIIFISTAMCAAQCGCFLFKADPRGEKNLRRRVQEFCEDWRRGDFDAAFQLCSHNFRTSLDKALFEHFMRKMPIENIGEMEIIDHLNLKEVRVKTTPAGGGERAQITHWRFERDNWFLDLIEWH
jgi:hypothetical protein